MATSVAAASSSVAAKTLVSRLKSVPVQYPLAFGVIFSGCKTSFSDLLVQKVVERREKVDWKRNAAFAAFGFIYLGGVQYALYVPIFGRLFPQAVAFASKPLGQKLQDVKGMAQMMGQVFLDQCVHHPLMYFPAFYCTKELVMADQPDLKRCMEEYKNNMSEDLKALWKIWVPATIINFSFMPFYARIPFVAGVSLLWTCILSTMRGGDVEHAEDLVGGAVTGASLQIMEEGFVRSGRLFTEPIKLDPEKKHIVLTASGRDKPGWVALLSRTVADGGGSITESKMVRLGDEFIIMMHVAVAPEQQKDMMQYLKKSETLKPLNVKCQAIARRQTGTFQAISGVRLRCSGADKPGMLASIAESLVAAGLSVENVHTSLQLGRGGRTDFVCEADCVATSYMDQEEIQDMVHNLSLLKVRYNLDVCDIRVQHIDFANRD